MLTIRQEKTSDIAAREALLDVAYGEARFNKPSERVRKRRNAADGLSFVAVKDGRLVGTVRLWTVSAGPARAALLLGPLAVHPDCRNRGLGSSLMRRAIAAARRRGHRAILLVGDASYYGRFGFSAERATALRLPGLDEQRRLLGHELKPGALAQARGIVRVPTPSTSSLADRIVSGIGGLSSVVPRAA